MNRLSSLQGFIDYLRSLRKRNTSCTIVFFYDDVWGKIGVHCGEILFVRCQSLTGYEALPLIADATEIKHSTRLTYANTKNIPERNICSEDFFDFFESSTADKDEVAVRVKLGANVRAVPRKIEQPAGAAIPRKKKILVAEDSRVARKYIGKVLLNAGYAVLEAESGFGAMGQLANERPDLLILDLIMPGIDGYRVLESVRKNPQFSDLPVFILTSRDSLLDKLRGRMSASDEYLTKPVDGTILLEKIARYLD